MRSMFFKRSRCREGKGLDKEGRGADTRVPPMPHVWSPDGARALCGVFLSGKQPCPHGDCHHGGACTRISMATARRLEKAAPPGGSRALKPAPGVCEGGNRGKGWDTSPALHIVPPSSQPPSPPSTHDRKTNGRTHLSTAHVSLTARAGFPWSMGFLKSVRSSSKAMMCQMTKKMREAHSTRVSM